MLRYYIPTKFLIATLYSSLFCVDTLFKISHLQVNPISTKKKKAIQEKAK